MKDYILVQHDDSLSRVGFSLAIMCGTHAECKAHAIWNKIDRYEIVHAPPPPPGWTDELTGVTYS